MQEKAEEWYERYSAELKCVGHDMLEFHCIKELSDAEVEALLEDVAQFAPNSMDIDDRNVIKERLKNQGIFFL